MQNTELDIITSTNFEMTGERGRCVDVADPTIFFPASDVDVENSYLPEYIEGLVVNKLLAEHNFNSFTSRDLEKCRKGVMSFLRAEITRSREKAAKALCGLCDVQVECLDYITSVEVEHGPQIGVYGGQNDKERKNLRTQKARSLLRGRNVA